MIRILDKRIDESSWLAQSACYPDIVYTSDDEPGVIVAVDVNTGATVGSGFLNVDDIESGFVDDDGLLHLGALGDNKANRHDRAIYTVPEFGPHHMGPLNATRQPVSYDTGPHNVEAMTWHRERGCRLMSKQRRGALFLFNGTQWREAVVRLPAWISDAAFTRSGRFVLIRRKGKRDIFVLDSSTWRKVGRIRCVPVKQGESVTVSLTGFWAFYGSEGKHSPLLKVQIPEEWQ